MEWKVFTLAVIEGRMRKSLLTSKLKLYFYTFCNNCSDMLSSNTQVIQRHYVNDTVQLTLRIM